MGPNGVRARPFNLGESLVGCPMFEVSARIAQAADLSELGRHLARALYVLR
jgi:hypothetical protein